MTHTARKRGRVMTRWLPFLLLLPALDLPAATLLVPSEYPTIQEAVNSATEGDTIIVSPGIYRERIDFRGPNIVLRSEDPDDPFVVAATIIGDTLDQPVGNYGIRFQGSETLNCRIEGLTVSNCHSLGIWGRGGKSANPTMRLSTEWFRYQQL